jgi:hypothetical protein
LATLKGARMAIQSKIFVHLVGSDDDQGFVHLNDFRAFCEHLENCLHKVEDAVDASKLVYLIDDLRIGSASVTLAPKKPKGKDSRKLVVDTFNNLVEGIESGRASGAGWPTETLLAFRRLAEPVNKRLKQLQIGKTRITTAFLSNVDRIIQPTISTNGSVKGRLEKLSVHGLNEFVIFSPLGYSVKCLFAEELYPIVHRAIRANVTVSGKLHYRADTAYPDKVQVEEIIEHPPDDNLPKLSEMKGTWSNATGGLSASDFLQSVRNG